MGYGSLLRVPKDLVALVMRLPPRSRVHTLGYRLRPRPLGLTDEAGTGMPSPSLRRSRTPPLSPRTADGRPTALLVSPLPLRPLLALFRLKELRPRTYAATEDLRLASVLRAKVYRRPTGAKRIVLYLTSVLVQPLK